MVGRLGVGAGDGRRVGGARRGGQHGRSVPRPAGVVDDARRVHAEAVGEHRQHATVELPPPHGRQLALHADAGDLVTEPQAVAVELEHPGRHALVDRPGGRPLEHSLHQPGLGAPRHHADDLEHLPRLGRQAAGAREHGVADRAGDLPRGRRQDLGDVKGVAARGVVEGPGGAPGAARELGDRRGAQRPQVDAADHGRRQLAERAAQAVAGRVGPERDHQRSGGRADPAPEECEQVERALVGPVQVLDHQHPRRALGDLVEQRRHQVLASAVAAQGVGQAARRPGARCRGTARAPAVSGAGHRPRSGSGGPRRGRVGRRPGGTTCRCRPPRPRAPRGRCPPRRRPGRRRRRPGPRRAPAGPCADPTPGPGRRSTPA